LDPLSILAAREYAPQPLFRANPGLPSWLRHGFDALGNNTTGSSNTANGLQALASNTIGSNNTANGRDALASNSTGSYNTAEGFEALLNNSGSHNIGLGSNAGGNLTTGSGNVCIGAGVKGGCCQSSLC
jgi:hypothetical protein